MPEAAEVLEIARAVANAGVMLPWIQAGPSMDLAAAWRSVSLTDHVTVFTAFALARVA